ncbi:hypothetical protein KKF61_00950 [Patescibacteria group bacterium]|nr:hypothetical protein [Patescibacteria group bacterium]MBU0963749.1 hypothetical protein [Patescibacteria group bacterium]
MFESSKDILYVSLSACTVIFTFFLCWGLYYIVMILKRGNEAVKQVTGLISTIKDKVDRLENLIKTLEEKISHTASYLPLLFKGMTELLDFLKKRKQRKTSNKAAKKQ